MIYISSDSCFENYSRISDCLQFVNDLKNLLKPTNSQNNFNDLLYYDRNTNLKCKYDVQQKKYIYLTT